MAFKPQDYDVEISAGEAALREMAGEENDYRKRALESQIESAKAARENAMEIAQLQASTSRYGIDVASKDRMRQLEENARQFDASHGLEIAKAYTAFSSTPDMMWAKADFMSGMERVGQGLHPRPLSSQGSPQAKTWADFAAIAQYNGSTVPGGGGGDAGAPTGSAGAGRSNLVQSGAAGAATEKQPTDPRVSAAAGIMKALPPSESAGADGQDWAALEAIRHMYMAGNPAIGKLTQSQQKTALAGMARLGYDPARVQEDFMRSVPGQKSPLLAA